MNACGLFAALVLAVVVALVCYDVLARNLGSGNLPWIVEVSEFSLPLVTLVAAPWLMYRGEHVKLDLLASRPALVARLDRLASAIALLVSVVLVYSSVLVIIDSYRARALVIKSLVFAEWWLFVPVPICFALLALECLRRLLLRAS